MKLSNISVIFIIIVIPIILLLSYYISLQINTLNMQTSYNSNQLRATREAIEAFEINTVEWNEAYSETADSKRRDVMASINTFTTNFANSLGVGGTNRENILAYVPAIACTLYDGYYIYSPTEIKSIIKDEDGVAVFMSKDITKEATITGYKYKEDDDGKILYQCESGTYKYNGQKFTLNPDEAKSTYSHILKPFSTYSARYKKGEIDITVNYTLDNYITIYGMVNGEYVIKSGYLTNDTFRPNPFYERPTEKIAWKWKDGKEYICDEYNYIYSEDNTKVYFDKSTKIPFIVNSNGIRTNLEDTTEPTYKKILRDDNNGSYIEVYQALCDWELKDGTEIKKEKVYSNKNGEEYTNLKTTINIYNDYSATNYYFKSVEFTNWVQNNLGNITVGDTQDVEDKSLYGNTGDAIFNLKNNNPEDEDSIFSRHKSEIIKQSLISDLNQAITSYSRNSEKEFQLPVLTETDWNHILRNVSIITFVQGLPIGMKSYNNYTVATSTSNKEYVNPDEIYLARVGDDYYHMPYCSKLSADTDIIGYRNIDYVVKSYKNENEDKVNYYYKYSHIANQACYYCLVQRDLFSSEGLKSKIKAKHEKAYKMALARERYVSHEFK